MFCQNCKKRPATVHMTRIVNNVKSELHLCSECAKQHQGITFSLNFEPGFSINKFLGGLLDNASFKMAPAQNPECPNCRLTFDRFSQIGKFGCSNCYRSFGEGLDPLLRRVQGTNRHTGKVPRRAGGKLGINRDIERLQAELEQAVREEAYERAAELRDRIRLLEQDAE
jgi:protein arginine kinase activator